MTLGDEFRFAWHALVSYPVRTALILVSMAIGVASVVVLTSLGDGARRYVTGEFSALGSNLLIVLPGRNETTGGPPPLLGETPRDLTLDDALTLGRSSAIRRVAPVVLGAAPVSWRGKEREVTIIGSTAAFAEVRELVMAQGQFLPPGDPTLASPICVVGPTIRRELFGASQALGEWLRIGDRRFRVTGILASRLHSIGLDLDDMAVIPVASAQQLFDTPSLFRILVGATSRESLDRARRDILRIIKERHDGEDDVTVITQDAVLATFDRILHALTLTVGGIASISLVVAGILTTNVMLVAVSQRTGEIGLLKALGAPAHNILVLFLTEAGLLALTGGLVGLALGQAGNWVIGRLYPALPIEAPLWAVLAALGVALGTGIVAGVYPARRAARLDPIESLARRM